MSLLRLPGDEAHSCVWEWSLVASRRCVGWVGEGSLRLPGGAGETVQIPPSPQASRASSPVQPRSTRPDRVVGAGTPAATVTGRGRLRFGSGAFAAKIPFGGMVERTKAAVLKTVGPVLPVPWVRIPLPPPMSYAFRVAYSPIRRRSSLRCSGVEPYCLAASVPAQWTEQASLCGAGPVRRFESHSLRDAGTLSPYGGSQSSGSSIGGGYRLTPFSGSQWLGVGSGPCRSRENMERWPSGRRRSPAKRVGGL